MLSINDWPLPYEEHLAARPSAAIDLVVIHCTELPDMPMAREFGERIHYAGSQTGNSGHYYIDRSGTTFRFVADARVANHTRGYNARSIGIELVNLGRYPHWGDSRHQAFIEPYTPAQIDALRALLARLRSEHANLRWIAGHEDLDRRLEPASDDPSILLPRRRDPGPLFPWPQVLAGSGLERLGESAK
ncbi:MAG: N-acetylmuramoyl-L-alanine amidase [Rhodanobacteraceae bacterium]|jgi:N-acetylmuramoyl-L-alanine amidase|nr:N-acetylmuramoyl-L-alanine amidase [Rhodanobacteraceae bacterium]